MLALARELTKCEAVVVFAQQLNIPLPVLERNKKKTAYRQFDAHKTNRHK